MHKYKHLIKQSWTYNHIWVVVSMALAVVILVIEYGGAAEKLLESLAAAQAVAYERELCELECQLEERALEIYAERRQMDLERYRQEAIQEHATYLLSLSEESPFVDYQQLRDKFGY